MAYNPNQLEPYDNPNAVWCACCKEQVMDDDAVSLKYHVVVHNDCLRDYALGLQLQLKSFEEKIEKLVERIMT
jgi:hypothetical protein